MNTGEPKEQLLSHKRFFPLMFMPGLWAYKLCDKVIMVQIRGMIQEPFKDTEYRAAIQKSRKTYQSDLLSSPYTDSHVDPSP